MSIIFETIITLPSIIITAFSIIAMAFSFNYQKNKISRVKRTPEVSVIVAAWNEGPRIGRCVNSIRKLDYPKENMEIIVVGGGTDNTADICKKMARKGHIKFLEEKERTGKWFALNRAVEAAKCKYLAFTDADGIVPKGWLKNLASYKDVDIIISGSDAMKDDGHVGRLFSVTQSFGSVLGYSFAEAFNRGTFSGIGSFMKKSIAKQLRFKKSYVEDYRFCYEAAKKGYKLRVDLETPILQGRPKTLNDLRKCYLRIFHGFFSEMLMLGDPFVIFMLLIGVLSLISTLIRLFVGDISTILFLITGILTFLISVVNMVVVSRIYKSWKYLLRLPYLMFFYIFIQAMGTESLFRLLIKRSIGWPIYNKT